MSATKRLRKPKTAPLTRLLLIRHGEVETRYQGVFGGTIDMNLSDRGHEQAKTLAKFLRGKKFDAIYASPMKRVQQTFAPSAKHHKVKQVILPGLREIHFGDWTGLNWDEVRQQFGIEPYEWLDKIELGVVPKEAAAKITDNAEWKAERPGQFECANADLVARVAELPAVKAALERQ